MAGHLRPLAAVLWMMLSFAPVLASAQTLSGLRVLPHVGTAYTFAGWQSEGDVPAVLTVPLDLGDEVYGATLQLQTAPGKVHRVRVQYQTSLGLGAEGPHLDLTGWKHCVSDWETAKAIDATSFVLPTPSAEQGACFPAYTQAELEAAIRAHARTSGDPSSATRWLDGLRTPVDGMSSSVSPFVAISEVRVRIDVLRNGTWSTVTTVVFVSPMGC